MQPVSAELEIAIAVEAAGDAGQDRATVVPVPGRDGLVFALADGAGGTGYGAIAAQAIVEAVAASPAAAAADPVSLLLDLERERHRLGHGQATAIVGYATRDQITGASVGDSGAWIIAPGDVVDLTADQHHKPLVGSGCTPVPFAGRFVSSATLLIAFDGLLKYARRDDIARMVRSASIEDAVRSLVALVRLRSGALPDDVAIVLCRPSRRAA